MFPEHKNLDLAKICSKVNDAWEQNRVFEQSVEQRPKNNLFVFYEGPPSANGLPGIHHLMARLIKDIFCRYKTLSGFRVERRAGWDTHGLPVELSVENELGIKKDDIGKTISISEYNKACKKTVMRYTKEWNRLTKLMGYWVDVDSPYITYENKYIETVWFLLKRLFEKNLIYKGYTIQPYSPAAGTGLSSHELNQPGCYKLVKDLSVVALFKMLDPPKTIDTHKEIFFMAWTTTPWTLFANTGLAVGKKISYVFVETINPYTKKDCVVICAKDRLLSIFDEKTIKNIQRAVPGAKPSYRVLGECLGSDLIEAKYQPPFDYVQPPKQHGKPFRVISADFVNTNDGTGIVHLAPTFGSDDFMVAQKEKLPLMLVKNDSGKLVPIVNLNGFFVDGLGEFSGRPIKPSFSDQPGSDSVDVDIVVKLKSIGRAFKSEKYEHSYPHCWRTDKPILYYPLDSWFIRSTKYKDLMIKENQKINWKPKKTGEGRFQNWLENINDWNLSRSRFWGIPLPIWKSKSSNHVVCVGSVEELKELCGHSVKMGHMKKNPLENFIPKNMEEENYKLFDLHKNFVDKIVLCDPDGEPMFRENDVIDVWFDSGAMPFAQWHYPFENKELIDSRSFFPADFIAEGVDQTRGWFFTLHAISVMCFGEAAYKNVVSNGLVLDKNGQKMSKRIGNTIDPFKELEKHGADSIRWYMATNSQPWDNLKFDLSGVVEIKQKFFSTLHNIYSFFSLYANIDNFKYLEKTIPVKERPVLDQWILSEINHLINLVKGYYNNFEPTLAGREIQGFVVDKLSNWYVRLCRRRFWKGEYDQNKISAYQTLYDCLVVVAKIASPIAPFYMDQIYCDLNKNTNKEPCDSVHLARFPDSFLQKTNHSLLSSMRLTKEVCSLALSLRKKHSIRVRQPLSSITVCLDGEISSNDLFIDLIKSEINVKQVLFADNSNDVVERSLVVNFPVLGKKHGGLVKKIVGAINGLSQSDVNIYEKKGELDLMIGGDKLTFSGDDLEVRVKNMPGYLTAQSEGVLVTLNTHVSAELKAEGYVREFVNKVQNIRKELGFVVTNRVVLSVFGDEDALNMIKAHEQYVSEELLVESFAYTKSPPKNSFLFEFNNFKMYIGVELNI
jgi:isoleucyl-tRNA synthetase